MNWESSASGRSLRSCMRSAIHSSPILYKMHRVMYTCTWMNMCESIIARMLHVHILVHVYQHNRYCTLYQKLWNGFTRNICRNWIVSRWQRTLVLSAPNFTNIGDWEPLCQFNGQEFFIVLCYYTLRKNYIHNYMYALLTMQIDRLWTSVIITDLGYGVGQAGVADPQPTTRSNPIGLVLKLLWSVLVKVLESVQRRDERFPHNYREVYTLPYST